MARVKIYGPPGAGKTTSLAALTQNAVRRHGSNVIVASLTRAAAAEIAGRDLTLPHENVGTLHHHCFRAIGNPPLVIKHLKEWNELHPSYAVNPNQSDDPDGGGGSSEYPGDETLAHYEILRHQLRSRDFWPMEVVGFANAWEEWKRDGALFDFTDLLEEALRSNDGPPGNPTAGIFDEVQDFSRLEWALLEKWSHALESVALAGDDDQCLYSFRAADPQSMLDFPCDEERILNQSYRIPAKIHELSQTWIRGLSSRMEKEFKPREEQGWAHVTGWSYAQDASSILEEAEEHIANGKTVMILASCAYMLWPIVSEARRLGIPFHNPYRRRARQWNPLHVTRGVSSAQRLLAYLRPDPKVWGDEARMWTGSDLALFSQALRAESFGGRAAVATLNGDSPVSDEWLEAHLSTPDLLDLTTTAFESHALASELKRYVYPLAICDREPKALRETPRLVIGTVHSVKGGEADVVYLSPEMSASQSDEWITNPDSIIRLFYVGMTRAREGLVVVSEAPRRVACDDLVRLVA